MVDHDERAVGQLVDAVDRAAEADRAPVGGGQRAPARRRRTSCSEASERGRRATARASNSSHRSSAARSSLRALAQNASRPVRPARLEHVGDRRAGLRAGAARCSSSQPVGAGRRRCDRRARRGGAGRWRRAAPAPRSSARERLDRLGLLDRLHAEHVLHEVGVRARRPRPRCGSATPCRQRSDGVAGEVAVVHREAVAGPGVAQARGRGAARSSPASRARADVVAGAHAGPQARAGGARRPTPGTSVTARPWAWESTDAHARARSRCGDEPARRVPDGGGPQVAARHGDDDGRGRGHGGEELAVGERAPARRSRPGRRGRARGRRAAGRAVGRGWQQALGGAEHDGEVDVDAGGAGQRADVDAVADRARGGPGATSSSATNVVRNSARVTGAPMPSRWARRSRTARRLLPRRPLGAAERDRGGRRRTSARGRLRPRRPVRPRTGRGRVAELGRQLVDERQQLDRRRRRRRRRPSGRWPERRRRSGAGASPSRPRARRRRRGRCAPSAPSGPTPSAAAGRHVGEQRHQVAAPQPAPVEVEELGEHPGHDALVDRRCPAGRSTARRPPSRWCSTRRA